jgi:hypothetical protein
MFAVSVDQSVRSSTRAAGPLVWTEAISLFLALLEEYILLLMAEVETDGVSR